MKRENGFSLISLLISTVISLIGIIATLTLYKSLVKNTAETVQSAQHEGQLSAALLAVSKELSNAGFRVTNPEDAFKIDIDASTHLTALTWFYQSVNSAGATVNHCRGLRAYTDSTPSTDVGGERLVYFSADGGSECSGISSIDSPEVKTGSSPPSPWAERVLIDETGGRVTIDTSEANCQPYRQPGITVTTATLVTLTVDHKTTDSTGASLETTHDICLVNLGTIGSGTSTGTTTPTSASEGSTP